MKTIEIDNELYDYIASQTQVIGESAGDILRRLINIQDSNLHAVEESPSSGGEHELTETLSSRILRFKPAVEQFLQILGEAAKQKPDTFENVLTIQGRDRKYFAKTQEDIVKSGASTQPKQIPGTEYWVMTNSPTHQKSSMLQQALDVVGFSNKASEAAAKTINKS